MMGLGCGGVLCGLGDGGLRCFGGGGLWCFGGGLGGGDRFGGGEFGGGGVINNGGGDADGGGDDDGGGPVASASHPSAHPFHMVTLMLLHLHNCCPPELYSSANLSS